MHTCTCAQLKAELKRTKAMVRSERDRSNAAVNHLLQLKSSLTGALVQQASAYVYVYVYEHIHIHMLAAAQVLADGRARAAGGDTYTYA